MTYKEQNIQALTTGLRNKISKISSLQSQLNRWSAGTPARLDSIEQHFCKKIVLYIDQSNGSDSNTGLSASSPLQSLREASFRSRDYSYIVFAFLGDYEERSYAYLYGNTHVFVGVTASATPSELEYPVSHEKFKQNLSKRTITFISPPSGSFWLSTDYKPVSFFISNINLDFRMTSNRNKNVVGLYGLVDFNLYDVGLRASRTDNVYLLNPRSPVFLYGRNVTGTSVLNRILASRTGRNLIITNNIT